MVDHIVRIIAGLFGLFLLLMGINWLLDPAAAAEGLGMPLLEGVGRSTQIGDLASFFVVGGAFAIVGVVKRSAVLMLTPAALVGVTAVFRTLAWSSHGAALATDMIAGEVVMLVAFLLAYWRFSKAGA
jgi:hypothetical protein